MKVITENSTAEIVEKKSRFIANIYYVANVDEAEEKLSAIRKKYFDAKHNCYAYILGVTGNIEKSSDDGEPQGTAGHPMLDILKGEELTNCIAIVTRYFGGILLGTGGLVRAYSASLKSALDKAKKAKLQDAYEVEYIVNYDDYGKVEKTVQAINMNFEEISKSSIQALDKTFEDTVKLKHLVNDYAFDKYRSEISNITRGKIILEKNDKKTYYMSNSMINYL